MTGREVAWSVERWATRSGPYSVCSAAEGHQGWSSARPLSGPPFVPSTPSARTSRGPGSEPVLGAVNYGRDSDSIANMGGASAGALGGLEAVPAPWVRAVTEGSRTDLLAPADLMADVAAEVFDLDRQRFEAHRTVVDRLVR